MRPAPLVIVLALLTGCATVPTQTKFMEEQGVQVSSDALRTRLRAQAVPFTGRMEEAADAARDASGDPAVRRRTLVWKVNVVPALYRSLFNQRPLVALLDTWALLLQAEEYLASPEGRAAFGPGVESMLATTRQLEEQVREIAAWAAPKRDLVKVRAAMAAWAAKHPVRLTFATRESLDEDIPTIAPEEKLSAMAIAGQVDEDIEGLVNRVDFLPVMVPRQATWQAELTYLDLVDPRMEDVLARAGKALDATDQLLGWLGTAGLEKFAAQQRSALEGALAAENVAVEALIEKQRGAVQAFAAAEWREAVAQLRAERAAIMADARALADHAAAEGARKAREVVDALVLRLALLSGAVLAGALLVVWVARRRRPA